MLYTYFKEIPVDILEAARMDGNLLLNEIVYVLTPMAVPGIASTMLLCDHPFVERGLLDPQPDDFQRGAVDCVHCFILRAGRVLLGQALGGFDPCHRAHSHSWLVLAEATGPRPDVWRGEVIGN